MTSYDLNERAASIISDAGGELVGRTRLQKVAYLCQLVGFSSDFRFEYRHYGPFSDELADAIKLATGLRIVQEEERKTEWGGWYSVFTSSNAGQSRDVARASFVSAASKIGALELELAATAAFLFDVEGYGKNNANDPWQETSRRKPEKSAGGAFGTRQGCLS